MVLLVDAIVVGGPHTAGMEPNKLNSFLSTLACCCLCQVLVLLNDVLNPSIQMYLNPQMDLSELPLKSFYRCARRLRSLKACTSSMSKCSHMPCRLASYS